MRGEIQHMHGVEQAAAVLDLWLGGVRAEMGDGMFDWLAAPVAAKAAPKMVAAGVPVVEGRVRETAVPQREVAALMPRAEGVSAAASLLEPKAEVKRVVLPKMDVPGELWVEGEKGGVLLVVQGGKPGANAVALAGAMLAAIGLRDAVVSWVGYVGNIKLDALLEAMTAQAPEQVLVLGQAPLGVLLGKNLGVEGWHATGTQKIAGWETPVGVTYPLELLMKQPLFKRLAWQHLLAWGETKLGQTTKNSGSVA